MTLRMLLDWLFARQEALRRPAHLPVAAPRGADWRVTLAFAAAAVAVLLFPREWIDAAFRLIADLAIRLLATEVKP
jgi:hypothetical protein